MLEKVGIKTDAPARPSGSPGSRRRWPATTSSRPSRPACPAGLGPDADGIPGTKGPSAWVGLDNPAIDKLLEEGRSTYDVQKRVAAYNKVQTMVFEEAYVGFVWRRSGAWAFNKAVKGVRRSVPERGDGPEVWLDR